MSNRPPSNNRLGLPSVDQILHSDECEVLVSQWGHLAVVEAIRSIQSSIRLRTKTKDYDWSDDLSPSSISNYLYEHFEEGYRQVFNLTGTLLHTNLGRATISPVIFERVRQVATRPATIEYDLLDGRRGDREAVVRQRLQRLTEAEDAAVVNNNAAALLLVLNTFAKNRKVIASRGELVEIGGSFRLPEIMVSAGCELLEVGTTNRTHLADYEKALQQDPALILKVHPSNYQIKGFTKQVETPELAELAKRANIPLVLDVGSGALMDTSKLGIGVETTPTKAISDGADLVTCSGDKLMGGPQAGIILGNRDLIQKLNSSPMKRALRLYKVTLALLDETLKLYEEPDRLVKEVDTIRLLSLTSKELKKHAQAVQKTLSAILPSFYSIRIAECEAEVGSGALPGTPVRSLGVIISSDEQQHLSKLVTELRQLSTPVIGRIHKQELLLDMHGAEPIEHLQQVLSELN